MGLSLFAAANRAHLIRFSPRKLEEALNARNMTPYALSKRMGVSTTWVQDLVKGKIRMPRERYMRLLSEALQINPSALLEDADLVETSEDVDHQGSTDPTIAHIHANLLTMRDLDPEEVESVKVVVEAMLKRLLERKRADEEAERRLREKERMEGIDASKEPTHPSDGAPG